MPYATLQRLPSARMPIAPHWQQDYRSRDPGGIGQASVARRPLTHAYTPIRWRRSCSLCLRIGDLVSMVALGADTADWFVAPACNHRIAVVMLAVPTRNAMP